MNGNEKSQSVSQQPKAMFVAGLIAGMLILALIARTITWRTSRADAGNH